MKVQSCSFSWSQEVENGSLLSRRLRILPIPHFLEHPLQLRRQIFHSMSATNPPGSLGGSSTSTQGAATASANLSGRKWRMQPFVLQSTGAYSNLTRRPFAASSTAYDPAKSLQEAKMMSIWNPMWFTGLRSSNAHEPSTFDDLSFTSFCPCATVIGQA